MCNFRGERSVQRKNTTSCLSSLVLAEIPFNSPANFGARLTFCSLSSRYAPPLIKLSSDLRLKSGERGGASSRRERSLSKDRLPQSPDMIVVVNAPYVDGKRRRNPRPPA